MDRFLKPCLLVFLTGLSCLAITPYLTFLGVNRPLVITDWALRVVANGGAMPSQSTIISMETFRLGVIAAGISNKLYDCCIFVPDSLIAATTPIFRSKGSDPWSISNFVSGDLTIEGLKGDGTTKVLNTGVLASYVANTNVGFVGNCGLTVLVTEDYDNTNGVEIGHYDALSLRPLVLGVSAAADTFGQTFFLSRSTTITDVAVATDYRRSGVICGNNIQSNTVVYGQSPLLGQFVIATNDAITTIPPTGAGNIYCFGAAILTVPTLFSGKRLSAAAVHDAFTPSEASALSTLLINLRTALGGGNGDDIEGWAARVVALGGAAPSTATKAAMRTFYTNTAAAGVLTNLVIANLFVPDNLVAARTPLIWENGFEIWANTLFDTTNLSVNGLTGNGTSKVLNTGVRPSTVSYSSFANGSAGVSIMTHTNPTLGVADYGGVVGANFFYPRVDAGHAFYLCWRATTINTDFLSAPPALTNGFISGNRTASNAIALYQANFSTSFRLLTNGTGSSTAIPPVTNMSAFAATTIAGFSDHTVSFIGMHAGLTANQASNLFLQVGLLRTNLGGGAP